MAEKERCLIQEISDLRYELAVTKLNRDEWKAETLKLRAVLADSHRTLNLLFPDDDHIRLVGLFPLMRKMVLEELIEKTGQHGLAVSH